MGIEYFVTHIFTDHIRCRLFITFLYYEINSVGSCHGKRFPRSIQCEMRQSGTFGLTKFNGLLWPAGCVDRTGNRQFANANFVFSISILLLLLPFSPFGSAVVIVIVCAIHPKIAVYSLYVLQTAAHGIVNVTKHVMPTHFPYLQFIHQWSRCKQIATDWNPSDPDTISDGPLCVRACDIYIYCTRRSTRVRTILPSAKYRLGMHMLPDCMSYQMVSSGHSNRTSLWFLYKPRLNWNTQICSHGYYWWLNGVDIESDTTNLLRE